MTAVSTVEMMAMRDVKRASAYPAPPQVSHLQAIAALSDEDIRGLMSKGELIQVIRSVEYPFAGKERLEYFDRDTLERVVCLVRRWSLRQLGRQTL